MKLKVLPKQGFRRSTWKNGLGHTDEIAIYPESAQLKLGDFDWRLSSATIEQNSTFSHFPDHDRMLVILKGKGVRLIHTFVEGEPEETVEVTGLDAYEFPGDVPSRCELISGGVTDLSVFLRKGVAQANLHTQEFHQGEKTALTPQSRWTLFFVVCGQFQVVSHSETDLLNEGDALRIEIERSTETTPPTNDDLGIEILARESGTLMSVSIFHENFQLL